VSANRRGHKAANAPGGQGGFQLPPNVSFQRQRLSYGWVYVFRHATLGQLGRVVLQDRSDGRCQLSCEVAGDPADPMTAERRRIFDPLGLELARRVEAPAGPAPDAAWADPPPRPVEPKELIESKLIPCGRCRTMVAMLIFAPEATDAGRLEDCARKMYREYTRLNLPTWIIGPALGGGPPSERPADILKVWPARAPIERLRPAQFNAVLDRIAIEHCVRS